MSAFRGSEGFGLPGSRARELDVGSGEGGGAGWTYVQRQLWRIPKREPASAGRRSSPASENLACGSHSRHHPPAGFGARIAHCPEAP